MSLVDAATWDYFLAGHSRVHILQTAAWGELKSSFGWTAVRIVHDCAGAQILFRNLPLGYSIAYIPKGPVGQDWLSLWPQVDAVCKSHRAIVLKVEPDRWEGEIGLEGSKLGFLLGGDPVQPRRTLVVNLDGSEDALLARMKQKTRYNIRLAEKKGVEVNKTEDLEGFHELMRVTGQRDGFGVHSLSYYTRAYELFNRRGEVVLLKAEYQRQPLAALMAFAHNHRSWYFYGASNNLERSRMPTYLLQWEAMRWARAQSCVEYDLWGVPDENEEILEEQFERRSDGLWGVYRFKRGFGGRLCRTSPVWEKVYIPSLYRLYRWYVGRRGEAG